MLFLNTMRFNSNELIAVAVQPSTKFEKEGVLYMREKQDGIFRKSQISSERWCRLRGNLLFFFKSRDPWSELFGLVVLEQCQVRTESPTNHSVYFPDGSFTFHLVFDGGVCYSLACASEADRHDWISALKVASYEVRRAEFNALRKCLQRKHIFEFHSNKSPWKSNSTNFFNALEVPICEVSVACDNLLCDALGRRPDTFLVVDVYNPKIRNWVCYGSTEIIEENSNPCFLSTIAFRLSSGLNPNTKIRFTVFDVKEKMSHTSVPMGSAYISFNDMQEAVRFRVPLISRGHSTVGFLSITAWNMEVDEKGASTEHTPCKVLAHNSVQGWSHRRSCSLPPKLGSKIRLPNQAELKLLYSSLYMATYRFHSGLGGDICVHEYMAESRFCFSFPTLLLEIWIQQEKELLQEVVAIGELKEPWHSRQIDLLDKHSHFLHLYSQARENLQAQKNIFFKPSSRKFDSRLEFAPVNFHLQRIWVYNDTLNKSGIHDCITVGAFTAHCQKSKNGGLIKMLHNVKKPPIRSQGNDQIGTKIVMVNDAIQAIKQLRREVVQAMSALLKLAKSQQPIGMLPICQELINKSRILLSLWDPGLVEEAFNFIEDNKLDTTTVASTNEGSGVDFNQGSVSPTSTFKRIIQQLLYIDLESPDLDNFTTPCTPRSIEELWACFTSEGSYNSSSNVPGMVECYNDLDTEQLFVENNLDSKSEETRLGPMRWDKSALSNSPSANYYKPSDEPEPWDITQLNIEASVMCLVSKVKFLCGRCDSPAIRLKQMSKTKSDNGAKKNNVSLKEDKVLLKETETQAIKNGNKFTQGLDLNKIIDWAEELRPSMKKLRQAMDGLLKTARLTHSVLRLQEDSKTLQQIFTVQYRRDVCFSQALTSLVTALLTRLWAPKPDPTFVMTLSTLGPLAVFEGLLSYHGNEIDMWGDMSVAVEDLRTVIFTVFRSPCYISSNPEVMPEIRGNRNSLTVALPVPDALYSLIPNRQPLYFHVTPVFFNIGINEMATLAESFGATTTQTASNIDNYDRLNEYYLRYRKLNITEKPNLFGERTLSCSSQCKSVPDLLATLKSLLHSGKPKNVEILHVAAYICRQLRGFRFTSCKSAKDRTGMSVTLEQCQILTYDYHLAEPEFQKALDCMRRQGCRRENTFKNTNTRKYAFNSLQLLALPKLYRPPVGTYGSTQT